MTKAARRPLRAPGWALVALAVVVAVGIASAAPAEVNCTPPADGSVWTIEGKTVVCVGRHIQTEGIHVGRGGDFTALDCQITVITKAPFNLDNGQTAIETVSSLLGPAAKARVAGCAVDSTNPAWYYDIKQGQETSLILEDLEIRDAYSLELDEGGSLTASIVQIEGVIAWSGSPRISNNLFLDNPQGRKIVVFGSATPIIENNTLVDCVIGIEYYAESQARIHHNTIACSGSSIGIWNGGPSSAQQNVQFNDFFSASHQFCGTGAGNFLAGFKSVEYELHCMDQAGIAGAPNHPERLPSLAGFAANRTTVPLYQSVRFTATGVPSLEHGRPVTVLWDFGDGSSAQGSDVTHSYDDFGTFTVRAYPVDDLGLTNAPKSVAITVPVSNRYPVVSVPTATPTAPRVGEVVEATTTIHDPDGDSMTTVWKVAGFPDGDTTPHKVTFTTPGTKEITVEVRDDRGGLTRKTLTLTVAESDSPPAGGGDSGGSGGTGGSGDTGGSGGTGGGSTGGSGGSGDAGGSTGGSGDSQGGAGAGDSGDSSGGNAGGNPQGASGEDAEENESPADGQETGGAEDPSPEAGNDGTAGTDEDDASDQGGVANRRSGRFDVQADASEAQVADKPFWSKSYRASDLAVAGIALGLLAIGLLAFAFHIRGRPPGSGDGHA